MFDLFERVDLIIKRNYIFFVILICIAHSSYIFIGENADERFSVQQAVSRDFDGKVIHLAVDQSCDAAFFIKADSGRKIIKGFFDAHL